MCFKNILFPLPIQYNNNFVHNILLNNKITYVRKEIVLMLITFFTLVISQKFLVTKSKSHFSILKK
jgi:hypothetical protein